MRSLPSDLLAKIKQSLQTIGNNSQPKTKITVARAKTTVTDSSYWTVEKIREKTGLGEIAVAPRRFHKHYGGPDRLYEIHVDTGEVKTAIREYPDLAKAGWQDQFSLGSGSDVAIAFDGDWEFYRKTWRLQTHEVPWIFWVDATGVLWGQLWDDETTKVELATQALRVSAIRAWKEVAGGSNDQGIVVAYVKTDGTLWYRNYCIQTDYTVVWEFEKAVTGFTGSAVAVNLLLTNDYRLGLVVENNTGHIWWLITGRTWSGMAIAPEKIDVGITDITFEVIPINYEDTYNDEYIMTGLTDLFFNVAEPIYPVPISASNPDKSKIIIKLNFNHTIDYDLTQVISAFTIKDSVNTTFPITSTQAGVDNSELLFNMPIFSGASGNMFIIYNRAVIELDCLNQGSRFAIESFTFEFTPVLEPPVAYASENIIVAIEDITFITSKVTYVNSYETENITSGITDISFIVTKVGSNPL